MTLIVPTIDLTDESMFERNEFWPALAWLRENDPVHWHEEADGPGFWALTRYADIAAVYADHEGFSSRYGMRLGSNADAVAAVSQRMLIVSDPPDHTHLKRVLSREFGPSELPRLERTVRRVAAEVMDEAVVTGDIDFLEIAKLLPNYVVCAAMDLPREDWAWLGQITTEAFEGEDEVRRSGAHGEIFLYFEDLVHQRRGGDGDDFVSRIARARRASEVPGEERLLTDEEIIFNCNGVLAGANETTRYSTAGGLLALIERPEQWARLRTAGPEGIAAAVEEILRWTVPGVHALRTATRNAEIGGKQIRAGERVTLWNVSANRDESMFDAPDEFRFDRSPNRHITFGAGRHLCLGARLARIELAAFLTELIDRVDRAELRGTPRYNASNFTWGLNHLPVRLVPKRAA
ncbi:cytochrome P450 [Dactylosporangium vinaceum]|uniref:Cytochrome P450 n=1 Tax=Dactylosporangium vinaceum TaxID=53362 RepID=A0ABV5MTX3_9ACTN|nr:cytochrome P450 [Dactylosporangium vinaceum]UAB97658.1 cytochrome P450 [Dactylosporangium vinaceum]